MGLLMLIMIGVVPGAFALNMSTDQAAIRRISAESQSITAALQASAAATAQPADPVAEVSSYLGEGSKTAVIPFSAMAELNQRIAGKLEHVTTFSQLSGADQPADANGCVPRGGEYGQIGQEQ